MLLAKFSSGWSHVAGERHRAANRLYRSRPASHPLIRNSPTLLHPSTETAPLRVLGPFRRPKAASSLERATKLPHVRDGKCFAHVYPKAGEAVVIGATARRP